MRTEGDGRAAQESKSKTLGRIARRRSLP